MDAPEPFAIVEVHDVVADVGPGGKGPVRSRHVAVVLPQPEVPYHRLGQDPPLAGEVQGAVFELLVDHGAVGPEAFVAGLGHPEGIGAHPVHDVDVPEGHGALQRQPGSLDVVSIGNTARQDGPVPAEIQLQVAVRGHHLRADDVQQVLHRLAQVLVRPHLVQVRIGLQDVEVRVHGLVGIDVMGAEGHVRERGEIARKRLRIATELLIPEPGLDNPVQGDSRVQILLLGTDPIQFAEAVDGEPLRI